jgi:hypothetical protein
VQVSCTPWAAHVGTLCVLGLTWRTSFVQLFKLVQVDIVDHVLLPPGNSHQCPCP